MFIPIILGTARQGRYSEKVSEFMRKELVCFGLKSEVVDVRDFRLHATDRSQALLPAQRLAEKVTGADALIIVSPEYNHGYPGELKLMLDMLYEQYFNKPVGFCGVSMGDLGGARVVEQLRQVAIELHMVPIREALYFSNVRTLFDDEDMINDVSYHERSQVYLDELTMYAHVLRAGDGVKLLVR